MGIDLTQTVVSHAPVADMYRCSKEDGQQTAFSAKCRFPARCKLPSLFLSLVSREANESLPSLFFSRVEPHLLKMLSSLVCTLSTVFVDVPRIKLPHLFFANCFLFELGSTRTLARSHSATFFKKQLSFMRWRENSKTREREQEACMERVVCSFRLRLLDPIMLGSNPSRSAKFHMSLDDLAVKVSIHQLVAHRKQTNHILRVRKRERKRKKDE